MSRGGETGRISYGRGSLAMPGGPFPLDRVEPTTVAPRAALGPGELDAAFRRPLASPTLDEIFLGARRVLVVVSDGTRSTAADRFLPPLLRRIHSACRAEVAFIFASGIHRAPTPAEMEAILGPEAAGRYPVLPHDPGDERRMVDLGRTSAGTPVRVNAALREHDRVVLTGAVGFHYYAGFSGGRKAVVPGLAHRETVSRNHLRALRNDGTRHPAARAGRLAGNPVHRDMAEGAARVGPHLLVNSIPAPGGGVERLYVGHWRRAHEAACRRFRKEHTVRLAPRKLVVASAGGWPADINLIQAHKAFEAGFAALEPEGVFVLAAECREGAGHPTFLPWFDAPDERETARRLRERFEVYGQTALSWRRKATRCRLILVSSLPEETVRRLGAEPARNLDDALRLARSYLPAGTRGWLLPRGSRLLIEPDGASGGRSR